uniref:Uncharacterized protein n=1 Tax=Caenorhabditis japonica TaxID=281687 RepID=A0A8R1ID94_CAEJA
MVWADQLGSLPKYGFGQRPFTLQQDWTPSHGSKSTKAVFDAHFPGYCFVPGSQSFGLFVWGYLQLESKVLARSQPNIEYLKQALLKWYRD